MQTRSEYNGSVVENRNFLLPKFFRRKTFNLDKRPEIYFYAILLCKCRNREISLTQALGCDTSTFFKFSNVLKIFISKYNC